MWLAVSSLAQSIYSIGSRYHGATVTALNSQLVYADGDICAVHVIAAIAKVNKNV